MSDLREDDVVTLVATITVEFNVARGDYENEDGNLPTDAEIAEGADQQGLSAADVFDWATRDGDVLGVTVHSKDSR